MRHSIWLLLVAVIALASATANAQDDAKKAVVDKDKAAIEGAIKSYVAAFNARDAKGLAAHWSPEGIYTSRLSGESIVGRDALEKDFTALFKEVEGVKLEVTTDSIEFVSPNVAIERGAATVVRPDASPARSNYSVVYVKRDGKWLVDRVSEEDVVEAKTHYEQLKGLEWMIGQWVDHAGGSIIETQCKWTRNQNFITRSFTASVEDRVNITGMQIVGWDAARKQIRSWTFDSDGSVAEGVWKNAGKHWVVKTTATLPDGKTASSTTILRAIDDNSFGWKKIARIADGEILPNIDEVVIVRKDGQ